MGDIKGKLEVTEITKGGIRNAIISKGVDVPTDAPFSAYAGYVNKIASGTSDGISSVVHDDSLNGSGTTAYPLGVNPRQKYLTSETLDARWNYANSLQTALISPAPAASGLRQGDVIVDRAGTLSYVNHPYDVSSDLVTTTTYLPSQMNWTNVGGYIKSNAQLMAYVGDTANFSRPNTTIVQQINYIYQLEAELEALVDQINGPVV
ncbi:hypothetical protein AGMMS49995_11020 [Endomicrobiia bacterium]|nr:hypothetical protein AGMMS49995_11020 [Endomicrobiia bacterium]